MWVGPMGMEPVRGSFLCLFLLLLLVRVAVSSTVDERMRWFAVVADVVFGY